MHCVTVPVPPFEIPGGRVHAVPLMKDNLAWLLECSQTGEVAVIDGPPQLEPVLEVVERFGLTLTTVWNTHTHWDHIGINQALAEAGRLDAMSVYGPAGKSDDVPGLTRAVGEGDTARVGALVADVWLTEGHMDGHVSFVLPGVVFCGDTLFAGGCGYLFDGPPAAMFASLMRLASLPEDTRVCCAHEYTQDNLAFALSVEPDNQALVERAASVEVVRAAGACTLPSTIGIEQATNPFLRPGAPGILASLRAHGESPGSPAEVFAATRALKDRKLYKEG